MLFSKKILVLKQLEKDFSVCDKPISGIARIEIENGVTEFFLSVINLSPPNGGKYHAFITDKKMKPFCLEWQRRDSMRVSLPLSPDLDTISVGVVFVKDYLPITVAFASENNGEQSATEFKRVVAEYFSAKRNEQIKNQTLALEPKPCEKDAPVKTIPPEYNDEAVATENYFEFDDIEDKLEKIKEFDIATLSPENELSFSRRQEKAQEIHSDGDGAQDEKSSTFSEKLDKKKGYYHTVQRELDDIFAKFPPEPNLEKMFFKSRWAKVYYSETKYYVVGLVFEDDKEKYICYGVPEVYSKEPPKELKGFCSFIPLSVFSLHGDGYWMMFQDAETGECKKPI